MFRTYEYNYLISLHLMFTKLDMIDNPLVLTNYFECHHDDVTADQFRLEFSIFWACEYNNWIRLHPIFTKLDMVFNRVVLTNFIRVRLQAPRLVMKWGFGTRKKVLFCPHKAYWPEWGVWILCCVLIGDNASLEFT